MKHPVLLGLGALLAGPPVFYACMAAVAVSYNHDLANPWMVAFLVQAVLGLLLGAWHKWLYLPMAAGMILTVMVLLTARPGPYAPFILAAGWPLALAGLLGAIVKSCCLRYVRPQLS